MLKQVIRDFLDDECPTLTAALAYCITFSLPALLFLLLTVAGLVIDPDAVQERLVAEFGGLIGRGSAQQIEGMITSTASGGAIKVVIGIAALVFGATGACVQLQHALNRAWEVKPDPKQGGVRNFIMKRLLSLGLILTVGFLLIVSLAISALLTALGDYIGARLGGIPEAVLQAAQLILSLAVLTAAFALIFKLLPDAETSWRDTLIGGFVTVLLFAVGKFVIGIISVAALQARRLAQPVRWPSS